MIINKKLRLYSTSIHEALKLAHQMPISNQTKSTKRTLRRTDFKLHSAEEFQNPDDQPLKWPKLDSSGQENCNIQTDQMAKSKPIVKVKRNEWDVITYI